MKDKTIDHKAEYQQLYQRLHKKLEYLKTECPSHSDIQILLDKLGCLSCKLGNLYKKENNHNDALEHFYQAGVKYIECDDQHEKALECFDEAIEIEKNKNISYVSILCNRIANIFLEKGDVDGALLYYQKSLFHGCDNNNQLSDNLYNIHKLVGKLIESSEFCRKRPDFFKQLLGYLKDAQDFFSQKQELEYAQKVQEYHDQIEGVIRDKQKEIYESSDPTVVPGLEKRIIERNTFLDEVEDKPILRKTKSDSTLLENTASSKVERKLYRDQLLVERECNRDRSMTL